MDQQLNTEQHKAAKYSGDGPMIIFAGAGTGKTRTLTHRIAYLIQEKGVPANRILAATYTGKAVGVMKERIESMINTSTVPRIGTLHSLCRDILRKDGRIIGINPRFKSFGKNKEKEKVLSEIMEELSIEQSPEDVGILITNIKTTWRNPNSLPIDISHVYEKYQEYLKDNNFLDYDDQLVESVNLLKYSREARDRWNQYFSYIFIDEFQDTNQAQYELVRILAEHHKNICAVGDDDQTIYSFAGANVKRMLDFKADYPEATSFYLGQNYRSTRNIIEVANQVISINKIRKKKELRTEEAAGEAVTFHRAISREDEAQWIAEQISALHRQGIPYSEIQILSRRNPVSSRNEDEQFTSAPFEKAFLKQGIPFYIPSAWSLYKKPEIQNLISYLRVISDPDQDDVLLKLMKALPQEFSAETTNLLRKKSFLEDMSLWEVLSAIKWDSSFPPQEREKLQPFVNLTERLQKISQEHSIYSLLKTIVNETNYYEYLRSKGEKYGEYYVNNVESFLKKSISFDESAICQNADGNSYIKYFLNIILPRKDDKNVIRWMTLHGAKGLEFCNVFLVSVDDDIFPDNRNELEEERRLFYVGITRARKRLFISSSTASQFMNEADSKQNSQEKEIPSSLSHAELLAAILGKTPAKSTLQKKNKIAPVPKTAVVEKVLLSTPPKTQPEQKPIETETDAAPPVAEIPIYHVGDRVQHTKFGVGKVIEVSAGDGKTTKDKIKIRFNSGENKLLVHTDCLKKINS